MNNKNYNKEFQILSILYFAIFFIPFIILGSGLIVDDPAWFVQYMMFAFSLISTLFFFFCVIRYHDKTEKYRKKILTLFGSILFIYIFSTIYKGNIDV